MDIVKFDTGYSYSQSRLCQTDSLNQEKIHCKDINIIRLLKPLTLSINRSEPN